MLKIENLARNMLLNSAWVSDLVKVSVFYQCKDYLQSSEYQCLSGSKVPKEIKESRDDDVSVPKPLCFYYF